jgi:hypothetical protein
VPAVVWDGEANTITLKLSSVNPSAESIKMNFGTNVLKGELKRFSVIIIHHILQLKNQFLVL